MFFKYLIVVIISFNKFSFSSQLIPTQSMNSGTFFNSGCQLNIIWSENLQHSFELENILFERLLNIQQKTEDHFSINLQSITGNDSKLTDEDLDDEEIITEKKQVPKLSKGNCILFVLILNEIEELSSIVMQSGFAYSESVIFYVVPLDFELEEITVPFTGFTAPLIFLEFEETKSSIYCYPCHRSENAIKIINSGNVLPNYSEIIKIHRRLNWIGHGRKALIQSLTILEISKLAKKNPRLKNCELYFQSEFECNTLNALWTFLEKKLNITVIDADDYYEEFDEDEPSLNVCLDCDINTEMTSVGSRIYYEDLQKNHIVYCTPEIDLERPDWKFFISAFDVCTWSGILLFAAIISLIGRDCIYFVDILLLLIDQGSRKKWRLSTWISMSLFLAITFISQEYECYMTTTFITPLEPRVISTVKDVFAAGYRLAAYDEAIIEIMRSIISNSRLDNDTIDENSFYIDPLVHEYAINWKFSLLSSRLADTKGLIYTAPVVRNYIGKRNLIGKKYNVSCHMVDELFIEMRKRWIMRSLMAESLKVQLNHVRESGIGEYFNEAYAAKAIRLTRGEKDSCEDGSEDECPDVKRLSLNSPMQNVVVSYCALCLLSGLAFFCEMLSPKLKSMVGQIFIRGASKISRLYRIFKSRVVKKSITRSGEKTSVFVIVN